MNIFVLGPTNSGKSALAQFFASQFGLPVLNCDVVQTYTDLNFLSNKPGFYSETLSSDGIKVCKQIPSNTLNFQNYENFSFKVFLKKKNVFQQFFFDNLERVVGLISENFEIQKKIYLDNYLFNINKIGDQFSIKTYIDEIERISQLLNLKKNIITGGTVYYAYHYLMGTQFPLNPQKLQSFSQEAFDKAKSFLEKNDSESLKIFHNHKYKILQAYDYFKKFNQKYSSLYYKNQEILENFLVILILPKSREVYVEKLNFIVKDRIISSKCEEELNFLKSKYSEEQIHWLKNFSYEYSYAFKFHDSNKNRMDLISELQSKERQYSKRQITFLRKLERDLKGKIQI